MRSSYQWFYQESLLHMFLQNQLHEHLNCIQLDEHSPEGVYVPPVYTEKKEQFY